MRKVRLNIFAVLFVIFAVIPDAPIHAKTIMVFAPHPDDEALMTSGIIYRSLSLGDNVIVVIVTNGDTHGVSYGYLRERESVAALGLLGLNDQRIIFLGYGDATLQSIEQSTDENLVIVSQAGQSKTYGDQGLGGNDYHSYIYGVPGDYNKKTIYNDIELVLLTYMPNDIYVTSLYDRHPDHSATYNMVVKSAIRVIKAGYSYNPTLHQLIIHAPNDSSNTWPSQAFTPAIPFSEPPNLSSTSLKWSDMISVDVPTIMQSTDPGTNLKYQAIGSYQTQTGGDPANWLFNFVKSNEFFWNRDFSDIGLIAEATCSSQNTSTGQLCAKAIDGVVDGYPRDYTREWATVGQLSGAWITLDWTNYQTVTSVVLHDRPNLTDRILSGTLFLSDGSSVAVGALPDDGSGLTMSFSPKQVSSMTFHVDSAVGKNIGLAEIEVYGTLNNPPNNPPQIIGGPSASPSTIADAQTSSVSVTASDADGDALTYNWSATGGSVSGTGATAVYTPPRVTNTTVYRVDVVVSDGRGGSASGSVNVTVNPGPNTSPSITAGPTASPSTITDAQTSSVSVTASDADGDALTYNWSATGGSVSGTGATAVYTPPRVTNTTVYRVDVVVSDGRGGSASGSVYVTVSPTPTAAPSITVLSPSSATAREPAFTLTVNGSGFTSGCVVRWNGSYRATTFVSTTQLTAAIPASDLAFAGTVLITVFAPAPGGGTSNSVVFTIYDPPVPTITNLTPSSKKSGGRGFTLTVNGTGLVMDSVVRWNGSVRATTFVSATRLRAEISASDIAATGTVPITVFTPAPGGGVSNAVPFLVK